MLSSPSVWLIILFMGLVTFAIRLSVIGLSDKMELPALLRRGLRFVPPAVLSAIIAPDVLLREGQLDVSLGNVRLLAGVLAALVAWRTKNVLLTIAVGMAALWISQLFSR
jgi:branched-subunit amino acid transport protein